MGRIISKGNKHLEAGSLICKGDTIQVLNGDYVEFLCFSSGNILKLSSRTVPLDKCAEAEETLPTCNPNNTNACRIRKSGAEGSDEPIIISPHSTSTLNSRPEITWANVKGATSYKVKVKSYEFGWEKVVNQTKLTYPSDEKEFQPGTPYTIYVFAYKDGEAFSYDETFVNVLSIASQEQIAQKIKRIKDLGLPPDETIQDVDAIYTAENLLNETIEMLKTATATGSRNPTLYRVLGDRYLKAKLPNEAKPEYIKAVELAKSSKNSKELQKAQSGLKLVNFYNQLPTNTKPPQ
ncbi:hypothetical protein H6G97_37415 [Nostoc flagelliforme FACHB-838]|uniref:Tetratricopeptide repeat protein n=1 Tax=Nostoc flagelliforme FACHB-838 TaxID=2692904 RepID=A0ABR8E0T1_9NOSO|nr:hypothetical protein [Nostoc flagelliforme]MBD2534830.1 hypothetical protein [Nostoc flagelliforme FACHB-838]